MSSRKQARVRPAENNSEIIEIRPGRKLRIQHLNARPRDEKFEREMQIYSLHRQKHVISSGPLTMPKRQKTLQKMSSQDNIGDKTCSSDFKQIQKQGESNEIKSNLPNLLTEHKDIHIQGTASGLMVNERKSNQDIPRTNGDLENSIGQVSDASMHSDLLKSQSSSFNASLSLSGIGNVLSASSRDNEVDRDLVIFFIHGVGGSSDIWYSQTQYFSRLGYEIIIPDLIGHGFSCAPKHSKPYHFKEIAADLEEIFDKYCKRRNIIIGHSYGASFASYLARYRPRRVLKIVLVSGGPPTPLAPQPGLFKLPYFMLACIKPCVVFGFHKGAFHKSKVPVVNKKEAFNIPAYVLQYIMNGQDWPDGDELFHSWLTCPCLLIYGADDQLVSLKDEQDMAQAIFDSQLQIIKDASHMVMVEAPDEVNKIIETFIKKPLQSEASMPSNSSA